MPFLAPAEILEGFSVRTIPAPEQLGRTLEDRTKLRRATIQLRFGNEVAALAIRDVWSACCELLLAANLVRERKLDRFILDVEQVFDIVYDGDLMLCAFSPEHRFAVAVEVFARSLEQVVEDILAGTSCPGVMRIAAQWGASEIRAQPYSSRFSNSLLM